MIYRATRVGLRGRQLVSIIIRLWPWTSVDIVRYRYQCQKGSAEEIIGTDESDCARVSLSISERALT